MTVRARRRRILFMLSGERVWIKVSKAIQDTKTGEWSPFPWRGVYPVIKLAITH